MIRAATIKDAKGICDIYNHHVTQTTITFEETPVPISEIEARIPEISATLPWLVFGENQQIRGYSFASGWKSRCAYRYSVESTVYVSQSFTNNKIGTHLYKELIRALSDMNYYSVTGADF